MIGLGLDLCEIARMERMLEKGDSFLERYFTAEEQDYIRGCGRNGAQSMAAFFAAKEALLKAMGIGMGCGVAPDEIGVVHAPGGQPCYALAGGAAEKLRQMGASHTLLSLSHEAGIAAAVAVIE